MTVRHHNKMTLLHHDSEHYSSLHLQGFKHSHFTIVMYFWFDNYRTKWSANKTSGEKINQNFSPTKAVKTPAGFWAYASKMALTATNAGLTVVLSDRIHEDQQRQYAESSVTHRMITSGCDCVVIRHYTRGQKWTCVLQPRSFSYRTFWLDQAKNSDLLKIYYNTFSSSNCWTSVHYPLI